MLKKQNNVVYFLDYTKNVIFAFIFILNWIFLSGSRDITWAKEFIRICQCFFLIWSATFVASDNNSYSKYSRKSFFCYFEKMNDSKHDFGTSSWIKNSDSIANIWTFENTTTGIIWTFSILHHVLFLSYTYFLASPNLILSFTYFCSVYIFESHYFRKCRGASQLNKRNVSLKARHG